MAGALGRRQQPAEGPRTARRNPAQRARLRPAAHRLRFDPRTTTLRPPRPSNPNSYNGGRLMAATRKKARYTLIIEAPSNGRIRAATVRVIDADGNTRATDQANLAVAANR